MTQLKTLKDVIDTRVKLYEKFSVPPETHILIDSDELREAARAWVEELTDDNPYYKNSSQVDWIKQFFNLEQPLAKAGEIKE